MAPKRRLSPPPKPSPGGTPGGSLSRSPAASPRTAVPRRHRRRTTPATALLYLVAFGVSLLLVARHRDAWAPYLRYIPGWQAQDRVQVPLAPEERVEGHADFGDGRSTVCDPAFVEPHSEGLGYVNVMLGNGGPEPNLSGGMIPAVAPPFAMTRWTPQTRQNYVSMCPYNQTDTHIHGFIGTHQPAVWMGESGPAQLAVGLGNVVTDFEERGLRFERRDEYASANYYRNLLGAKEGNIEVEMTATSRVGHLRFTFRPQPGSNAAPFVVLDGSRASIITSNATNVTYTNGGVTVDKARNELYGWNDERQDRILVGTDLEAKNFKGYFVARFDAPIMRGGTSRHGKVSSAPSAEGHEVSAWATFAPSTTVVTARVGVSFISVEQARRNLELEIPDGQTLERTSKLTREKWTNKLDRLRIEGASEQNLTVAYTGFAHTLVYPYEVSEKTESGWKYYSGYLDRVVDGISYSGYSIWDTFRAATAWQLFVAVERVPDMITSMLQDYVQGGWLPMWKNIVETNIMVGTHSDSIIAQAMSAGIKGFDYDLAWEAVKKNAFTPPDRDTELTFFDREEHTPQEARAGLTEYMAIGYVAEDLHAESGSRTLDYAYDDHAAAIVARTVGDAAAADLLQARARSYVNLWNAATGFMEARFANGSFAGPEEGWTEGDHWAYTLNVMHDVPGLMALMGGKDKFVDFLDRHFHGGHNLHTNEPSHHIPYLYAWAAPYKAQEWIRSLGGSEYNHTDIGLSGNEDCGQMSAWYLFSMLGIYPVDPARAVYVVGAPFFDYAELRLGDFAVAAIMPGGVGGGKIVVRAPGASKGKKYVKRLTVNGRPWNEIEIPHAVLAAGAELVFEMSDRPESWPN